MNRAAHKDMQILTRLRLALPTHAQPRTPLLAFLRRRMSDRQIAFGLTVTNVFYTGDAEGVLCQFVVNVPAMQDRPFVAPITQIAFDRRHLISMEIGRLLHRGVKRAKRGSSRVQNMPACTPKE